MSCAKLRQETRMANQKNLMCFEHHHPDVQSMGLVCPSPTFFDICGGKQTRNAVFFSPISRPAQNQIVAQLSVDKHPKRWKCPTNTAVSLLSALFCWWRTGTGTLFCCTAQCKMQKVLLMLNVQKPVFSRKVTWGPVHTQTSTKQNRTVSGHSDLRHRSTSWTAKFDQTQPHLYSCRSPHQLSTSLLTRRSRTTNVLNKIYSQHCFCVWNRMQYVWLKTT